MNIHSPRGWVIDPPYCQGLMTWGVQDPNKHQPYGGGGYGGEAAEEGRGK